ncbi:MAG: cytochrome c3 family protein [Thermoanaerobaculia bacterium]
MLAILGCSPLADRPGSAAATPLAGAAEPPRYVGRATCAACHPAELAAWQGSHHDLAMQEATAQTVLGDFSGTTFNESAGTSQFFRRGKDFFVRTAGPGSRVGEFRVAYTFGVEPLQQYLLELPGGRYQAFSVAWDSRPAAAGGQRWYSLYPAQLLKPGDSLHWTGRDQNWNSMCADCHSTGLDKGYLPAEDRFETRFAEIDVSCEACHGPASGHLAWAEGKAPASPGRGFLRALRGSGSSAWGVDPATGNGRRTSPPSSSAELETCARCHSRRDPITPDAEPGSGLFDAYRPVSLEAGLYFPDGQIEDEVFEYGSFVQSKMHGAGVVCSDCHDPHRLTLRAEGNALCARCHSAERFDSPAHHHHSAGTSAARCTSCHMPARNYLVVDPRRDHSLRVPRPDLSARLGTPNACNGCHTERSAAWAAQAISSWTGRTPPPHWGEVIAAGREGRPDAPPALGALAADPAVPAIARATALVLLGGFPGGTDGESLRTSLADAEPMVREAALVGAQALEPEARLELVEQGLGDPSLTVRLEAGRQLAALSDFFAEHPERLPSALGWGALGHRALDELRAALAARSERPESQLNLSSLEAQLGNLEAAEAASRRALSLDSGFVPARLNLAEILRRVGRDSEAEQELLSANRLAPRSAEAHHALGLARVRRGDLPGALAELAQAARLAPEEPSHAYAWALTLEAAGRPGEARSVLRAALSRSPNHRELALALVSLERSDP